MGHAEGSVVELGQLAASTQIVVARDQPDLIGRVAREPAQNRQPVPRRVEAFRARAEVEVIADRDELDVGREASVVAEQAVPLQYLEEPAERCLGIAYRHPARAAESIRGAGLPLPGREVASAAFSELGAHGGRLAFVTRYAIGA